MGESFTETGQALGKLDVDDCHLTVFGKSVRWVVSLYVSHHHHAFIMSLPRRKHQQRARYFVNVPVYDADMATIECAAALRNEPRATYVRRVVLREARADLRRAERKAAAEERTARASVSDTLMRAG